MICSGRKARWDAEGEGAGELALFLLLGLEPKSLLERAPLQPAAGGAWSS